GAQTPTLPLPLDPPSHPLSSTCLHPTLILPLDSRVSTIMGVPSTANLYHSKPTFVQHDEDIQVEHAAYCIVQLRRVLDCAVRLGEAVIHPSDTASSPINQQAFDDFLSLITKHKETGYHEVDMSQVTPHLTSAFVLRRLAKEAFSQSHKHLRRKLKGRGAYEG
ncbi:3421_t:CDS:2, partial [Acaulospora colombiana]